MNGNPTQEPESMASRLLDGRNPMVHNDDSDLRPALTGQGAGFAGLPQVWVALSAGRVRISHRGPKENLRGARTPTPGPHRRPTMSQPFDVRIDRAGTNSLKWEFVQREDDPLRWDHTDRFLGPEAVLPMWVADMDFRCPEPVVEALVERAQHGIYGYTVPGDGFYGSVVNWMARRHGWDIAPEWICLTPGVVAALNMLVRTFVSQGERVLIQPPVYYPFYSAVEHHGAEVVRSPLVYEGGRYRMDFEDLAEKLRDPKVRMAILCSPHNPVGRVWSKEELSRFGELCLANNVLVVSDEIHGDLVYEGHKFTPFATIDRDLAQHSVICTAPSKTFNMAGLHTSCIVVPNEDQRARFRRALEASGLMLPGSFGVVALQAAYDHGEEWLEQVLHYLKGNLEYLEAYVSEQIPEIDVIRPEGTYLVWLDCRRLGLDKSALKQLIVEGARVYLDEGVIFGPEGEGFERINIACPRSLLGEALDRIRQAIATLRVISK
jgi:cystathionine beta-lyase